MKRQLEDRWFLISSKDISDCGKSISMAGYNTANWHRAKVPGTVISALVDNGVCDDPYFGLNLEKLPGHKKRRDINFSLQQKPEDSPFGKSWWYRREFTVESGFKGQRIWLNFRGINYSANIWLNGKKIAGADCVKGTFRLYDFDVTDFILFGKKNALAVEVFSPGPDALALTFIDWAPGMPDDNMGIWQPIVLYSTGPAALKNTFVSAKLDTATFNEAELTIETEIINTCSNVIEAEVECEIEDLKFCKNITLKPLKTNKILFTPGDFPGLKIKNPRLWWPYQLGSPDLYKLKIILKVKNHGSCGGEAGTRSLGEEDGKDKNEISDSAEVTFGIRDIKAVNNEYGARQFIVNGKKLLVRGAAWTPDLMLRQSERQDEIDTDFVLNLNLNAVRLEGKLATDYFWDLCDRKGILVIAGWPCCNHFEKWDRWKSDDIDVARESERSQILRLRNHPSFAAWLYGSDFPPPGNVEKVYLEVLGQTYGGLPAISSASHKKSKLTGVTGVKMTGPYSYVPPVYWYDKKRAGRAEGFNTETCPDVCIPIMESIKKMIPGDQLFTGSRAWNHHAGVGEQFNNTKKIDEAISKRYGKPGDMADYVRTAQILGYESWRAMYEAHNRNFPGATGVIGWMLNSPWPSLIWQLYDYYLSPTGAFFGTKKACEPLHIQYSYDDRSIWIINNEIKDYQGLEVSVNVYNFNLDEKLSEKLKVDTKRESRKKIFVLPEIDGLSEVYFLKLYIKKDNTVKSRQLYWLATKKDIFTGKDLWYRSPLKAHADMSLIRKMPHTRIDTSRNVQKTGSDYDIDIEVKNKGNYMAFFVWVKLYNKKTDEILAPVFWSDNCVFLFPGESVKIKGMLPGDIAAEDIISRGAAPGNLKAEGWNC
jgi:exo-1,4-beta-D-glucosaminidase